MTRLNILERVGDLRYRPRYFGWAFGSFSWLVLFHLLVFPIASAIQLEFLPLYSVFFLGTFTFGAVTATAYFTTRTFAPDETIDQFLESNRTKIGAILLGGCISLFAFTVIAVFQFGALNLAALLVLSVLLILYLSSIVVGYDAARTRNLRDRVESSSAINIEEQIFSMWLSVEEEGFGRWCRLPVHRGWHRSTDLANRWTRGHRIRSDRLMFVMRLYPQDEQLQGFSRSNMSEAPEGVGARVKARSNLRADLGQGSP